MSKDWASQADKQTDTYQKLVVRVGELRRPALAALESQETDWGMTQFERGVLFALRRIIVDG